MTKEGGASFWRVLGLLDGVRRSGSGYEARCPGSRHKHDDKNPSLSIGTGYDGRVLLNCHAGCDTAEILAALHLSYEDLFEHSREGNPVRRFNLQNGVAHVREDTPNGKVIRWESNGKNGLNGTRTEDLPLYRAPDLIDRIGPVIVTEGEKAAEALAELGLLAVGTVTGAAGTPGLPVLAPLQGREVWLWPDNDKAGVGHMQRIAQRIKPPPKWIDWPAAPPKGDAADYVAGGGTAAGVAVFVVRSTTKTAVAASTRPDGPRIWEGPELAAMVFDMQRWAIPSLLPAGLTILAGRPKLGKSWLALGWALDIARGSLALRRLKVVQGRTLYLALEDGPRRMQERMALMLGELSAPPGFHVATEWRRTNEGGQDDMAAWLTTYPDTRLIVIDTFKRIRPIEKNSQRLYDLDYDAIAPLAELARQHNVAIVLVFHTRKAVSDDPLEMISGTMGVSGAADAVLVLRRERGQADASLFVTGRDVEEQDLALRWEKEDTLGWALLGNADDFRRSRERQVLVEAVSAMPGMKPAEIADAIGKSRGSVRYLLFKMVQEGELRVRDGGYHPGIISPTTPPNTPNSLPSPTPVSLISPDSPTSVVSAVSGNGHRPVCRVCGGDLQPGLERIGLHYDCTEAGR